MADAVDISDLPPPDTEAVDISDLPAPDVPEETAGRVAGLGARALGKGVADLGSMAATVATLPETMADATTRALGLDTRPKNSKGEPLPKEEKKSAPKLSDFVHPDKWPDAAEYFANKLGLPSPETPSERIGSAAVEALPSAVLAPEAPVAAGLASALGGAASQTVAEAGGGPIAQIAAGLAAGSVPSVAAATTAAAARGLARGASGEATAARAANAAENNVPLSVGQATGNKGIQKLEVTSGRLWGGAPIQDLANEQNAAVARGVDEIVGKLNPDDHPLTKQSTGETIEKGAKADKERRQAGIDEAYDKVDALVPDDAPVDVSGTLRTLDELAKPDPGAENSTARLTPPQISQLRSDLRADTGAEASKPSQTPAAAPASAPVDKAPARAVTAPAPSAAAPAHNPMSGVGVSQPYNAMSGAVGTDATTAHSAAPAGTGTPPTPNPMAAAGIADQSVDAFSGVAGSDRTQRGGPPVRAVPSAQIPKPNPMAAAGLEQPKTIPYSAAVALRTKIGRAIEADPLGAGDLRRVYAAMTADRDAAASAISPEAKQAVTEASALYKAHVAQQKKLDAIIKPAGGPEGIYNAAISKTRDGATKIGTVMGALDPDSQNIVRATVLRRLGTAPAGAKNAGEFDAERFLTGWGNIAPEAKDALFGKSGTTANYRKDLDSLAQTIKTIREAKELPNHSGTGASIGHAVGLWGLLETIGTLAGQGHVKSAVEGATSVATSFAANRLLSGVLTNPKTVNWLAKATKLPTSGLPNAINQLQKINDPDAQALAAWVRDSISKGAGAALNAIIPTAEAGEPPKAATAPYRFGIDPLDEAHKHIRLVNGKISDMGTPGSEESVMQYIRDQQRAIEHNKTMLDSPFGDLAKKINTELQQQVDNANAVLEQYRKGKKP